MRNLTLALVLAFVALNSVALELVPEDCLDRVCITKYDSEHEEYLKRVLSAMGLTYSVKTKDGRNVVIWKSAGKEQEEEVLARVSHYFSSETFVLIYHCRHQTNLRTQMYGASNDL